MAAVAIDQQTDKLIFCVKQEQQKNKTVEHYYLKCEDRIYNMSPSVRIDAFLYLISFVFLFIVSGGRSTYTWNGNETRLFKQQDPRLQVSAKAYSHPLLNPF